MTKDEYGDKFKDHLLEQYKLYVKMVERARTRKTLITILYIAVLIGLLAVIASSIMKLAFVKHIQWVIYLTISAMGLVICWLWYFYTRSYKQIISGKLEIIDEMEQQLPFSCYKRELEKSGGEEGRNNFLQLSFVEQYAPFLFAVAFMGMLFYFISYAMGVAHFLGY